MFSKLVESILAMVEGRGRVQGGERVAKQASSGDSSEENERREESDGKEREVNRQCESWSIKGCTHIVAFNSPLRQLCRRIYGRTGI